MRQSKPSLSSLMKKGYCGTTIYELVDAEVKITKIEPSLDTEGFYKDFSTLIDMCPGRYKAVLVEALENEIEQLQEVVRAYKSTSEIPESMDDKQSVTEEDDAWINEILG